MNKFPKHILATAFFLFTFLTSYGQLFINEWMPSNETNLADEVGEFDDWLEIYNSGPTAIDMGGYYLSDDPADLQKWKIPAAGAEVTCPAGGHLLFWADGDIDQGATHVDFKLSANGESILLTGPDGVTIIDQITYGQIATDIAQGRFPDGDDNIVYLPTPTPLATNIAGGDIFIDLSLEVTVEQSEDDGGQFGNITLTNKPNLNLGQDAGTPYLIAVRFPNISLSPEAIIEEAYIQFSAFSTLSDPANYTISLSNELDAAALVAGDNGNISNRTPLSNSVDWTAPAWVISERGEAQKTSNFATLVQDWIGQGGWKSGGAMMVLIEGDKQRDATSFDGGDATSRPKLFIKAKLPISNTLITDLKINEIAASGTDYIDEFGAYEDWVELHNSSNSAISLTGLYLTDNIDDLGKWAFPTELSVAAQGYDTYWTDNDNSEGPKHTNFSLKGKNDWLGLVQLTNTGYHIIDSTSWVDIPFQAVLGRSPDATGEFKLLGDISPNATNNAARLYLAPPVSSVPSGLFPGPQSVALTHTETGVSFFYTLDGSVPTTSSTPYSAAININDSKSLRAIATKSGYTPSQDLISTYIIGENPNIPILSITTDPDNFFDDEIGIYVVGTNGVANQNCAAFPANWAQDWERPGNLQLIYPDGTVGFSANAGIKISGACSRNQPMKSLAISTREQQYGTEKFAEALFPEREGNDYFRLKVRNSGQDYYRIGFRDLMNQQFLLGKIDLELQAGITTLMFLNGEFWGIHNIREKYAGEYFERIYGVKEKNVNIVKSPGQPWMDIKQGSAADYLTIFDFMQTADMTNQAHYDELIDGIDINSFISYWTVMSYLANYDWPENNIAIWKESKPGKKWIYAVTDTDGSTNNILSEQAAPEFDILSVISDPTNPEWEIHKNATLFLRKLWEREEFNHEFAQRSCSIMGIIFPASLTDTKIDSLANLFSPNVQRQIDRWFDAEPDKKPLGGGMTEWQTFVNFYKDFFVQRPDFYRGFLKDKFGLSDTYDLTFIYDENTTGSVYVNWNDMEVPFNHVGKYFLNIPLRVKAVADPGYEFVEWLETGVTDREIDFVSGADAMLTPIFQEVECVAGEACDDYDDCTVGDVYDADCICKGTFQDTDEDGTCDADDLCPGFDDNLDADGDGIPDGCDDVAAYEVQLAEQMNVFPNPAKDILYIENKTGLKIQQIRLLDLAGKELQRIDGHPGQINLEDLPAGVIGINLILENGVRLMKKIVIQL